MANPKGNYKGSIKAGGIQRQFIPASSTLPNGLDQQIQQPYIQKGLTYKSNNKFVMNRDDAGNIILEPVPRTSFRQPRSTQNLIIEPSIERILNKSVIDVSKTQFTYFKFPAKSKSDGSNLGFDNLNIEIEFADPTEEFNTRYVPEVQIDDLGQPITWKRICCGYPTSKTPSSGNATPFKWFTGETPSSSDETADEAWRKGWFDGGNVNYEDTVEADFGDLGITPRLGWARFPFIKTQKGLDQFEEGSFTLTPEMIIALREANKTLKFDITIQCYITAAGGRTQTGTTQYGSSCWYGMVLTRTMPGAWRANTAISPGGQMVFDTKCPPNLIKKSDARSSSTSEYASLNMEYIIDIDEAFDYDKWFVQLAAEYKSYYLADVCHWDIQVINDPGSGNYGVQ